TISLIFYFFFFQAEDGIRDRNVTGVQTCLFRSECGDESMMSGLVERVGHDNPAGAVGDALVIAVRCRRLGEPVHSSYVHAPGLEIGRASCREGAWLAVGRGACRERE